MANLNWANVQTQDRIRKNGLEIDKTVGSGYDIRPKQDKTEKKRKTNKTDLLYIPTIIATSRKPMLSDYVRLLKELTANARMKNVRNLKPLKDKTIQKIRECINTLLTFPEDNQSVIKEAEAAIVALCNQPSISKRKKKSMTVYSRGVKNPSAKCKSSQYTHKGQQVAH